MKKRITPSISSKFYLISVLFFLFFLDGFVLWYASKLDYDRTLERARLVLQQTCISLEERMKRTVVASEAILSNRAQRIQEVGIKKTISSVREWEQFRRAAEGLPDAGSLWLLDDKANLLLDSTRYPSQPMNFSEREYFTPQRDKGIEFYIGPIVKGKITKKYSFTISHRINGKDGRFLGIVLAAIEADDFTNFLRNLDIGKDSTVSVFRTDGALILRQPMQDEYLGKTFLNLKLFSMPFDSSPSGVFESSAIDGTRRLLAYRKIDGLPLLAATGVPVDSVLQPWRTRLKNNSVFAAFIFFALIGLSLLVRKTTLREEKERTKELFEINESLKIEIAERERTQIALKKSEQRWATTLVSIGDAVIATDAAGNITFMNAVAEELTGWTLSDAAARSVPEVFNIINEQTRREVENPVAKVLREGMVVGLANHTILVKRDGTEVPIDDSGAPIRGADGEILGVVLVFRDITERKQTEDLLRKSRIDLERSQEVAQIGSWRLDIKHNVLTWSDENYRIFGVAKGTPMTYEAFLAIAHPDDCRYVDTQWNAALAGEPYDIEHRIVVNGQVKWVREKAYMEVDEAGRLLGGFGITQDITERKRAEEDLRESRALLQAVLDSLPDAVFLKDAQSRIIMANPATLRIIGKSLDEMIGKDDSEHYADPEVGRVIMENDRRIMESGAAEMVEEIGLTSDGYRTFLSTKAPWRDTEGRVIGLLGITRDITDRKRMEDALRQSRDDLELRVGERTEELRNAYENLKKEMNERAQLEDQLRQSQKMEAIGTLAGGIAHDFNNVLAAILGFTEMAMEDAEDRPEVTGSLQNVLKASKRARDLVKQILAFSRKTNYERAPLSLSPLVKETVQLLRASIPSTIEIKVDIATSWDYILAAPVEVQQILMNLATNASLAMQQTGGTLEIALTDIDFTPDSPVLEPDVMPGEYLQLTVKDTGVGMTLDVMKRVFEPFFTTREVGKGTGMGLAVVYGIVKDLQGTITVESTPGTGSIFRVFLPKVQTEALKEETHRAQISRGTERILFIDDEEMLVEWGRATLERLGYKVTAMTDGKEALDTFSSDPSQFNLVITDHTMPGITGLQFAKELLKIKPDTPIILCTGHSETVSPEIAKEAGIWEYLMKPLSKQELAEAVRRVLDQEQESQ